MFPLSYPCTGKLSHYYKSFDENSVFGFIFYVIACNGTIPNRIFCFLAFWGMVESSKPSELAARTEHVDDLVDDPVPALGIVAA